MILKIKNLNLKQIAESGQCFRWKQIKIDDNGKLFYAIPAFGKILVAVQDGEDFDFSCSKKEWDKVWKDYFDFTTDYESIEKQILNGNDDHLKDAFKVGYGVRILKQDLWEMIFSFMVSQNNNIKRISKSIDMFCERVHKKSELNLEELSKENRKAVLDYKFNEIYAFPLYNEVSLDLFDDASLGFGYRAPYLREICEYVSSDPCWFNFFYGLNYDDAMKELMSRKGIGMKVANCICLFGLHHTDAFPIDTHVKQLLDKYYSDGFDFEKYQGYAGIIQQYLFYYELLNK